MSCMSQNFRLFQVSNLSVRNFRIFLLMYPGSVMGSAVSSWPDDKKRQWYVTEKILQAFERRDQNDINTIGLYIPS